jgi:hypothetical protein
MIKNASKLFTLTDVVVSSDRQRKEIDLGELVLLAQSITKHGLLQNIGVTPEGALIFGARRYTAFCLLNALASGVETEWTAKLKDKDHQELKEAAKLNPLYDNWTKIPSRLVDIPSGLYSSVLEFLENASRIDLPWQERAAAVATIHKQALADALQRREAWRDGDTAKLIGCSRELVSQLLQPTRKLAAITDPQVRERAKVAIKESKSAISASNAVEMIADRHGVSTKPTLGGLLGVNGKQLATPTPAPTKEAPHTSAHSPAIVCADFNEWAAEYSGPKFNFLHCDFPYGVEFNESAGQGTSAATRSVGEYDDGEGVYWALLDTLLNSRDKLLEPSAHIMLWLSVGNSKLYKKPMIDLTKQRIMAAWPDADISSVFLIWCMSDNSGLLPDPKRAPRRTYEIALQITLGDRLLAAAKAASFIYPRNSDAKIHRSQKHLPVLTHFLSMFCDSSTRMLDPTCGSGLAVLAAHMLRAQTVLGLELDPEMAASAQRHFDGAVK